MITDEAVASLRAHTHSALNSTHTNNYLTHTFTAVRKRKKKEIRLPIMNYFQSRTAYIWRSRNVPPSYIYIVVLGNDAFPFFQQINKSDRFVVCSYFFFIVYVETKKNKQDTIIKCKHI